MSWPERIVVDPEILAGKPVMRGTRLAVEFILELLAAGQSETDVRANPGYRARTSWRAWPSQLSGPRAQGIPAPRLMRLIADENFPLPHGGIAARHDVTWARRRAGSLSNGAV